MRASMRFTLLAWLSVLFASGCVLPRTKVVKNPGPDDTGVRYYRPKPYLLVQPAADSGGAFVTIAMVQLPDYEEEYSIHVRTGLGANHTNITLTDGWNLTGIDQDLDSNFDENVGAIADLVSAAGGIAKPSAKPGQLVVHASNVPIGYYESIISRDSRGCKRLYGWRYIGFTPYEACPVESNGVVCHTCHEQPVYALTFRDGVMVFEPLADVAVRPVTDSRLVPGAEQTAKGTANVDVMRKALIDTFGGLGLPIKPEWLSAEFSDPSNTKATFTLKATKDDLEGIEEYYKANQITIDGKVISTVGGGLTSITVVFKRTDVPSNQATEEVPTPSPEN